MKPLFIAIILIVITLLSCEDTGLNEAIAKVRECADFTKIESTAIDHSNDSTFVFGRINDDIFSIKTGFKDYESRLNKSFVLTTTGQSLGTNGDAPTTQVVFQLAQADASGESFYGDHLFGFYLDLPCSTEVEMNSFELLSSLEEGQIFHIRDRSSSCTGNISIALKAFCYQGRSSGMGGDYLSTPLTTQSGLQIGNTFTVDRLELTERNNGTVLVHLEASFTADLYFTTTEGGPIHYGKLTDGKLKIHRTMER